MHSSIYLGNKLCKNVKRFFEVPETRDEKVKINKINKQINK